MKSRLRSAMSDRSCWISEVESQIELTEELEGIDGAATSAILSARTASLFKSVVSEDARTIRTFCDRRRRNSSLRKEESVAAILSPSNFWIRRRSWVGLRSPCKFFCAEELLEATLLCCTKVAFRVS